MADDGSFLDALGTGAQNFFGGIQNGLSNPNMLPMLGLIQGYGAASAPSRMPVTKGMVFGDLAGGWGQGIEAGQKAQAAQIQNQLAQMTLQGYRALQQQNGMGVPLTAAGAVSRGMTPAGSGMALPFGVPGTPAPLAPAADPTSQAAGGTQRAQATVGPQTATDAGGMPPPPAGAPAPSPLFNIAALYQQYRILAATPGMAAQAAQVLKTIQDNVPVGAQLNSDGSLSARPGFEGYTLTKANNEKGMQRNPDGSFSLPAGEADALREQEKSKALGTGLLQQGPDGTVQNLPGVVAASSEKAGAVRGAEKTAEVEPTNAEKAFATQMEILAARKKPIAVRGGNSVVVPDDVADGKGPLYTNTGETGKTGTELAEETAASRVAAEGAYTQRALYGKMLGTLNDAHLGTSSEDRTKYYNLLNTLGFDYSKGVTQDQVFDKLSTQVAGQATKQLDQTANAALETMRKAYPNRDMTPQALKEMVGQLSGLQDYIIAKDQARQAYIKQNNGSADGFVQSDWVKQNTPEKFIEQGIKRAEAGAKPAQPGAATPPAYSVGQTATGPNGAKIRWDGKQWQPVNGQ